MQLGDLGERFDLPQPAPGPSPDQKRILDQWRIQKFGIGGGAKRCGVGYGNFKNNFMPKQCISLQNFHWSQDASGQ